MSTIEEQTPEKNPLPIYDNGLSPDDRERATKLVNGYIHHAVGKQPYHEIVQEDLHDPLVAAVRVGLEAHGRHAAKTYEKAATKHYKAHKGEYQVQAVKDIQAAGGGTSFGTERFAAEHGTSVSQK
ncbi:MAG TPA: hypothetical protein VEH48_02160 [Candidatus Nitrosopolaris sp.]|nr:hypothetical protein [Candidatus Nitrosopolaris sp.]